MIRRMRYMTNTKYPFIGESFEEMVEGLSRRYDQQYSRVYDLMTSAEIHLIIKEPRKYMFKYTAHRNQAYMIIERYLGIERSRFDKLREGKYG